MTYKIIFSFLAVFMTTFICTKPKAYKEVYTDLPRVDSTAYTQCVVRYKNSLYDNNLLLEFKVNVVYIRPISLKELFQDYSKQDSVIEVTLNKGFEEQGILFSVDKSDIAYEDYSINDFEEHFEEFGERDYITIIVYPDSPESRFNGVAAGIPHTICGVIDSKLATSSLVHEVGHLLGLKHIFEKDDTNGKNAVTGDAICDTGSYNIMDNRTVNCGYVGAAKYSEKDLEIIIPNYLNYNSESIDCRDRFTPVQTLSMRWHIENFPTLSSALYY
jgi:hypothetical protein